VDLYSRFHLLGHLRSDISQGTPRLRRWTLPNTQSRTARSGIERHHKCSLPRRCLSGRSFDVDGTLNKHEHERTHHSELGFDPNPRISPSLSIVLPARVDMSVSVWVGVGEVLRCAFGSDPATVAAVIGVPVMFQFLLGLLVVYSLPAASHFLFLFNFTRDPTRFAFPHYSRTHTLAYTRIYAFRVILRIMAVASFVIIVLCAYT
jgi:hypothetical protein